MMVMRRVTAMMLIKSIDIRIITIMMTKAMAILPTKNNDFDGISVSMKRRFTYSKILLKIVEKILVLDLLQSTMTN